ncbi:hypothetical protein [Thermotalea metallivorans]|uniref:Uncharacterized protein n=1 Tax=Thermotalea metallivorans TaxID=520762 RepID=A0A140L529_9FIRM|nr:hypothetical protein [Thermotalea metallivorans]KXG75654.1 hypothetical protein AN619_16500 [Thermotalea metallivorans]
MEYKDHGTEPRVEGKEYHKEGTANRKRKMTYMSNENESFLQRLSDGNIMPDGLLTAVDQTNFVNLIIGESAAEENIESHRRHEDLAP